MRNTFLFIALFALTQPAIGFAAPPSDDYELVWSDEFDGETLDTAKWMYRGLGPRRKAVNVKECVALDGEGHLLLTTRRNGDRIETAMIATQGLYQPTFGYFECRVELQDQPGHWSAFWLQSPTVSKVGDPKETGTEVDIYEYLAKQPDTLHLNLHWDGYGKDHKHTGKKVKLPNLQEGFHTIGLEWTPEKYVFYFDGKPLWETTSGVSHRSEYIILSQEVDDWGGDINDAELPDSSKWDYVRVYQKKR